MTQIGRHIAPSRRPNELGVHSLNYFVIEVPDLAVAKIFYSGFGLEVREQGNALRLYTHGNDHCWGVVEEGPRKSLKHLSFGMFADDTVRFTSHLDRLGVTRIDPPLGIESNGLWFRDPDGTAIELRVADKSSPNAKAEVSFSSVGPNARGAPFRGYNSIVQPRRLAHILLFTKDVTRSVAFYTRVLGLRVSDEAGGVIAFLHGIHGSDHHLIAFANSDGPGFHHCSWDVASVNEIGSGAQQMAERGFAAGWGLGRHVLGSNYFHYVRDPWGSYSEYSCDIDFVPADRDWRGQSHSPENSLFLWGPEPPIDFTTNYESVR
jgi:catechol 2,3-dioxygenase-like lactoylglutathione lyase family enzyme